MTQKIDYEVITGFWHLGNWIAPAPEGKAKRTIALTAEEAKHYWLDGSIALPTADVPAGDAE